MTFDFDWNKVDGMYETNPEFTNDCLRVFQQDDDTWAWMLYVNGEFNDASQFHNKADFKTHYDAMKEATIAYWTKIGEVLFTDAGRSAIKEAVAKGSLPSEVLSNFNIIIFEESNVEQLNGE